MDPAELPTRATSSEQSVGDEPVPYRTRDGSLTLQCSSPAVFYHSVHGAVQESTHVFIRAGLEQATSTPIRILEVGSGTGLNLLLTWIRCLEGKCTVDYTALEPFPLDAGLLNALGYCEELGWPGLQDNYLNMMTGPQDVWHEVEGGFRSRRSEQPVQSFKGSGSYDLIYFDPFGPRTHPDMWSKEVFDRMFDALVCGGALVTYCAQGDVRRTMIKAGFFVQRLEGPPGKREMLRASKPMAP